MTTARVRSHAGRQWAALAMIGILCAGLGACEKKAEKGAGEAKGAPEGQVVARVNGQEITIHEVEAELGRSGIAEADDIAVQEAAVQNVVRRKLFAQAALERKLDREPAVILNLEAAREAVLGEAYMMRELSAVASPSITEIDDYIASNPLMFTDRRSYIVRALNMAASDYSDDFVPLFDETADFTELKKELTARNVKFDEVRAARLSTDFGPDVRNQLARLGINDNLVVRTETSAQIVKIEAETPVPIAFEQARVMARSILLQERLRTTAGSLEEGLRKAAQVEFLGPYKELGEKTPEASNDRMGPIGPASGIDELRLDKMAPGTPSSGDEGAPAAP